MVAIRFKSPGERADGYMLLARSGRVRTLRGEIYVCTDATLAVLDAHKISYEKVPLPLNLNEVESLRDTPTSAL